MERLLSLLLLSLLLTGGGCAYPSTNDTKDYADKPNAITEETLSEMSYDQDSWKEMIPESCLSYFDGCNNCRRTEGSDLAACTKKFCQAYDKPMCLDEEAS